MKENKLLKALEIAADSHFGMKDKQGRSYIEHPVYVALSVNTEEEKIVALLHDTIEDTKLTLEEIRKEFGDKIADAVDVLTHQVGVKYMDYIKEIKKNPLARAVKLADLEHNMDISRIPNPKEVDFSRVKKYKKAKEELLDV